GHPAGDAGPEADLAPVIDTRDGADGDRDAGGERDRLRAQSAERAAPRRSIADRADLAAPAFAPVEGVAVRRIAPHALREEDHLAVVVQRAGADRRQMDEAQREITDARDLHDLLGGGLVEEESSRRCPSAKDIREEEHVATVVDGRSEEGAPIEARE